MDVKCQYSARYKKDLSTETLRAKVAHRKSLTQKENRHKAFRKSRLFALADVSPVKESDLSSLDLVFKKNDDKSRELVQQRIALLNRFKEEKQLRKLKEQREQAKRGIFKCGIYKNDPPFPSFPQVLHPVQVKTEKPAQASESRVTRSVARSNLDNKSLKTRVPISVANSSFCSNKGSVGRQVPSARAGSANSRKQAEKENLAFPVVTQARTRGGLTSSSSQPNRTIVAPTKPMAKLGTGNHHDRNTAPKEKNKVVSSKEKQNSDLPKKCALVQRNITTSEPKEEKENAAQKKTRQRSFAPLNFQFQPLDGLSIYKFNPMTPRSTNKFLSPCFSWSPAKIDTIINVPCAPVEGLLAPDPAFLTVAVQSPCAKELQTLTSSVTDSEPPALAEPAAEISASKAIAEIVAGETEPSKSEEIKHDVPYFRAVLRTEIERLTLLCVQWDQKTDVDIPEDSSALIRTTVGQTRLLMSERFKQFEGLVDDCELKRGEKETTCTDLDGFWDMVCFQIEDVLRKFADLTKLQDNGWQQVNTQVKKVKKKMVSSATSKPSQGDNARVAARNRLAAIKAAMKNKIKQDDVLPEASDRQSTEDLNTVVFDAGFFKVESPAKSIQRSSRAHKSILSESLGAQVACTRTKLAKPSIDPCAPTVLAAEKSPDSQTSPSPLLTTVTKALFGSTDNLLSIAQEDEGLPMTKDLDSVDSAPVSNSANVADIEEHLLASRRCSSGSSQSQEQDDLGLAKKTAEIADVDSDYSEMQDFVMCSPENNNCSTHIAVAEHSEVLESHERDWVPRHTSLDACCDPLDFLKSGTPPNAAKLKPTAPVNSEYALTADMNDLMVFSPVTM
ncbi:disks large-associated protein 5 isoform X2 [Ambystoma mexicanum]|uniref:disks large-associated protein 5 isoform X2 n=1 Tax=Ambystoma mexicanum TaxID=8296 RepID=UPI0037E8D8D8